MSHVSSMLRCGDILVPDEEYVDGFLQIFVMWACHVTIPYASGLCLFPRGSRNIVI